MRALLFTIWIQADESVTSTLALLKQLTKAQMETVNQGGGRMINASLSGKSFSFELPDNWQPFQFEAMIWQAYRRISLGGASGGQMTDAELQTYVLDANDEVTDTLTARIANNNRL
tara:strand:+ start:153 stop:500 length:348 start_codon:yes stop_codon:yes gene_type:complete